MTAAYRIGLDERSELLRRRRTTRQIGVGLQLLYQEVVETPVPEEWLELVRRIDERGETPG